MTDNESDGFRILTSTKSLSFEEKLRYYEELVLQRHETASEIADLDVAIANLRDEMRIGTGGESRSTETDSSKVRSTKRIKLDSDGDERMLASIRNLSPRSKGPMTAVFKAIRRSPDERVTPKDVARVLKLSPSAAQMRLKAALKLGLVRKAKKGRGIYEINE